jgi:hypothetical protein
VDGDVAEARRTPILIACRSWRSIWTVSGRPAPRDTARSKSMVLLISSNDSRTPLPTDPPPARPRRPAPPAVSQGASWPTQSKQTRSTSSSRASAPARPGGILTRRRGSAVCLSCGWTLDRAARGSEHDHLLPWSDVRYRLEMGGRVAVSRGCRGCAGRSRPGGRRAARHAALSEQRWGPMEPGGAPIRAGNTVETTG